MAKPIVMGANIGHDGGCTILADGKIVATMAEERVTRMKHAAGWMKSFVHCLAKTHLTPADIDLFVFSHYRNTDTRALVPDLRPFGIPMKKVAIADHHLSHAAAAYFTSPFKESMVLVFDAQGNNNDTESAYRARGNAIEKIGGNATGNFEQGIVAAYQSFTSYFGWNQNDAGKTMGLAPYGNPKRYARHPIFVKDPKGTFRTEFINHTSEGIEAFCRRKKIPVPQKFLSDPLRYKDMAAWIQAEFERATLALIGELRERTGLTDLCLSGGGALNTVCNTRILRETGVKRMHFFPASGDSGQSIGNALWGHHMLLGRPRRKHAWTSDFRNESYADTRIEADIEKMARVNDLIVPRSEKMVWKRHANIARKTAELIAAGAIVGWFQGGSEIGPRALGHRSILCDPRKANMKDILNARVKHREGFRPFAGAVPEEEKDRFFDFEIPSPFMMFVAEVKKEQKKKIPAVVHVDGTCRLQTVARNGDPLFHRLLLEFGRLTGIPVILNTSFNLAGEPIVETPFDALKCFLSTGIDVLILGNYVVSKVPRRRAKNAILNA